MSAIRTGLHGLAERVVNDDGFRSDGATRLHEGTLIWLRQQLVQSLAAHVDGRGFRLQRDQQLVGVARRRDAGLDSPRHHTSYRRMHFHTNT